MSDNVNKPSHYAFSEIECIDYLRAIVPLRSFIDHCRMSAIAYITRSPHKGSEVEDIDKAINYLQRARNEAEKAIEAAESNCPEVPDSSSGKAIPIPSGWRELEPDEMPKPTDMHEWMGGWVVRSIDSGQPYKWHDRRNIRKIETPKPELLAIPEGWRELEARETPIASDMYEHKGRWLVRADDSSVEYEWYDVRHIRKIETANTSEAPNSSIPDPGPGYRLLSKEPPERLLDTDEGFFANGRDGGQWLSVNYSGGDQLPLVCYRRKIEPAAWIPKVGDRVRVNYPRRTFDGKVGVIVEGNAGMYAVRLDSENFTAINLEAEYLELIEAANVSETPNSSIPNPGEGYRLLSKEPPEQVIRGDEYWHNFNSEWVESENFIHEGGPQSPELYYRRKIEPTEWIPKVGDRVRVNRLGWLSDGKIGVIAERDAGEYAVRIVGENLKSFNLKAEHLELIEAAS